MGFGALAKQTTGRNWPLLLLLHDPCHRAPLYLLEYDFRSLLHAARLCKTVTCPSLKGGCFLFGAAAAVALHEQDRF